MDIMNDECRFSSAHLGVLALRPLQYAIGPLRGRGAAQ
jgi:hypothetical protein